MSSRDITLGDFYPRGQLMTIEQNQDYILDRIQEFLEGGVITEDEARFLRAIWPGRGIDETDN